MPSILNPEQRVAYEADGDVIVCGFFDREEATLLKEAMEKMPDQAIKEAGLRFAAAAEEGSFLTEAELPADLKADRPSA